LQYITLRRRSGRQSPTPIVGTGDFPALPLR